MEEEIVTCETYKEDIQEIKETLKEINTKEEIDIEGILNKYFNTLEEQKKEKEKEQQIMEEEQQKQLLEEQKIIEEEKEKQEEFYSNIETIALNSDTEVTIQLLTDVSTLLQASIMTNGLLIGIVCISLFAKFFKR